MSLKSPCYAQESSRHGTISTSELENLFPIINSMVEFSFLLKMASTGRSCGPDKYPTLTVECDYAELYIQYLVQREFVIWALLKVDYNHS